MFINILNHPTRLESVNGQPRPSCLGTCACLISWMCCKLQSVNSIIPLHSVMFVMNWHGFLEWKSRLQLLVLTAALVACVTEAFFAASCLTSLCRTQALNFDICGSSSLRVQVSSPRWSRRKFHAESTKSDSSDLDSGRRWMQPDLGM